MPLYLTIGGVVLASLVSFFFSSMTYSLREFSRPRLAEFLGRRDGDRWFESITEHTPDLIFLTAIFRQFANILIWVLVFAAFEQTDHGLLFRYSMTVLVAGVIAVFLAVTIPHAAAKYAAAELVGFFAPVLYALNLAFSPLSKLMHGTDDVVRLRPGRKRERNRIADRRRYSLRRRGRRKGRLR